MFSSTILKIKTIISKCDLVKARTNAVLNNVYFKYDFNYFWERHDKCTQYNLQRLLLLFFSNGRNIKISNWIFRILFPLRIVSLLLLKIWNLDRKNWSGKLDFFRTGIGATLLQSLPSHQTDFSLGVFFCRSIDFFCDGILHFFFNHINQTSPIQSYKTIIIKSTISFLNKNIFHWL